MIVKFYITFLIVGMILSLSSCAYKSGAKNNQQGSAHNQFANSGLKVNLDLLFGTKWELIELNEKVINKDSGKQPFLKFERIDKKAFGNGGCNSFSARYYIMDSDSIKFSEILSTKMACDKLMLEEKFFEVLSNAGRILINNDTLQLLDNSKVLAKFKPLTELK